MHKLILTCCAVLHCVALVAKETVKTHRSQYGFIENKGQIIDQHNQPNSQVLYLWNGGGINVHLKQNSFSYEVRKVSGSKYKVARRPRFDKEHDIADDSTTIYTHRVDVALVGANANPSIIAEGKSADYINYYTTGTPEEGATFVHHYSKLTYKDIYPNIDMEFVLAGGEHPFKYNFIVRPGGEVADIKLKYEGANAVTLKAGALVVTTTYGDVTEEIPLSFEEGTGRSVGVVYQLVDGVVGFKAGVYDKGRVLVIDPWATYYGGSDVETGYDIASDNEENIVVVGVTQSISNIATNGAHQTTCNGFTDAFLAKFDNAGNRLWATYYGGEKSDFGTAVSINNNYDIFIAGMTPSDSNIATSGAYQPALASSTVSDFFIAKFRSSGIRVWSTYYGGTGSDHGRSIATDNQSNVIVAGNTTSDAGVTSAGAHQTNFEGANDALLVKFDSSGNRLWATYYGKTSAGFPDEAPSVCTDGLGNIILAGTTTSIANIASPGAHKDTLSGAIDAFVVKFNPSGTRIWGTYYGGDLGDEGQGVACELTGNIILCGFSNSTNGISTPGAHKAVPDDLDAFVAKFDANGTRLWGTYYGGTSDDDVANDVAVGDSNNIVVTGRTNSLDGIATVGAYQTFFAGGGDDAFVVKFDSNGIRQWGTYFGGFGADENACSITASKSGDVIIAGYTNSQTGIATPGAYQTYCDLMDAFIASFTRGGVLTVTSVPALGNVSPRLMQVYPNPAKEEVHLVIEDKISKGRIDIIDITGKVMKTTAVKSSSLTITVKSLPAGVYILQYEDDERKESVKVVKE